MQNPIFLNNWKIYAGRNLIVSPEGQEQRIEPKMMAVLLCLIEAEGEPVSKELLFNKVWEDTVVTDHSLSRVISHLRKILNDNSSNPAFIETIPKRGYRLIPPVVKEKSAKKEPATSRSFHIPLFMVALVGIIVLLYQIVRITDNKQSSFDWIDHAQISIFTTSPGIEQHADISNVDQSVIYAHQAEGDEQFDLFYQLIDSDMPVRLTQTMSSETMPRFSPDGSSIAYLLDNKDIRIMPTIGGGSRLIYNGGPNTQISHISWSSKSDMLAFSMRTSNSSYAIYLLDLSTFEVLQVTRPDPLQYGDQQADFSPIGDRIVFGRMTTPGVSDLWIYDLKGKKLEKITSGNAQIHGIEWVKEREIIFASNRSKVFNLWTVDPFSKKVSLLNTNLFDIENPVFSSDHQYLAFEKWNNRINIHQFSEEKKHSRINGEILIQSNRLDWFPSISYDGENMAFVSDRTGISEIWISKINGTEQHKLTNLSTPYTIAPVWSPDGKWIAFESRENGQSGIFIIDVRGGVPRRITREGIQAHHPFFVRDPDWVYYTGTLNGESNIWKTHIYDSTHVRVTSNGAMLGKPTMNDEVIYHTKAAENGIWKYEIESNLDEKILDVPIMSDWVNWTVSSEGIHYVENIQRDSLSHPLYYYDFKTKATHLIGSLEGLYKNSGLSFHLTTEVLYFSVIDRMESDIIVVKKKQ